LERNVYASAAISARQKANRFGVLWVQERDKNFFTPAISLHIRVIL
jgi:hypothetical protein